MKTTGQFKIKDRQLDKDYAEDNDVDILLQHRYPRVRQTVVSAKIDSNGYPDFLTINGNDIDISTNADEEPLMVTYADGFDIYGEKDWVTKTNVTLSAWTGFEANQRYYLYIDLDDNENITFGKTLSPPQYGYSFSTLNNSLLHFNGSVGSTNFIDEYGHGWTVAVTTATMGLSTAQTMFGSTSLYFNGIANNYIYNSNLAIGDAEAFTIETFLYPTTSGIYSIFSSRGTYGLTLLFRAVTGGLGIYIYMSTNSTGWTTSNIRAGTATVYLNTWNHICAECNGATTYFYLNGNYIHSVAGKPFTREGINIGALYDNTYPFLGYMDEFRYTKGKLRYNTGIANFTAPTVAFNKDNDLHFFSIPKMKMYAGSGLEDFVTKKRVFLGETVISTTGTPSSVIDYALNGKYTSPITIATTAAAIIATISDNIGVNPEFKNMYFFTRQASNLAWSAQQKSYIGAYYGFSICAPNKNITTINCGAAGAYSGYPNMQGFDSFLNNTASCEMIIFASRSF